MYIFLANNVDIDKEIIATMSKLDKLRTSLYNEFKPKIEMLEDLKIEDSVESVIYPLVATKKVTQVRVPPKQQHQDSQPEILREVERDNRLIQSMDLPPSGQLIKPVPEVDDFVFTMKHPLFPWIKGKVDIVYFKPNN
jgi:histone-lysine N-methyltransferase SETDB1